MVFTTDVLHSSLGRAREHLLERKQLASDNKADILSGADSHFWYTAFKELFLDTEDSPDGDDLLFFVNRYTSNTQSYSHMRARTNVRVIGNGSGEKRSSAGTSTSGLSSRDNSYNGSGDGEGTSDAKEEGEIPSFYVLRHHSAKIPEESDISIDWESTYYLNMILHGFHYILTIVIGTRGEADGHIQPSTTVSKRVYPSPSRTRMDQSKGTVTELTYPRIFFPIDDFEDFFHSVVCKEKQVVCVELTARCSSFVTSIFQGSVPYSMLLQAFQKKASASSWNPLVVKSWDSMEFLKMRGPNGVGQAEMAVCKVQSDTSSVSANALCMDSDSIGSGSGSGSGSGNGSGLKGFFTNTLRGLTSSAAHPVEQQTYPNLNACLTFINVRLKHLVVNVLSAKPQRPLLDPSSSLGE
eukprot:CFRG3518T1